MNDIEESKASPENTNAGVSGSSRFEALKIPVAIAIGFLLGETIGKDIGAGYAGFGKISGSKIGEWIGFAVGITLAMAVVSLFMTKVNPNSQMRRVLSLMVIAFAFIASSLVAVVTEAKMGELGGPFGFVTFWLIVGSIAYMFGRKFK
jgi:CDP-diglyceride synthetase